MPFPPEGFHRHDPNLPNTPDYPDDTSDDVPTAATAATSGSHGSQPAQPVAARKRGEPATTDAIHVLFGTVEDLLANLTLHGAPDGGVVRVERLVRTRTHAAGGTATLGVAVTARREDEVLSAWVIVGRLALDPWGQPLDHDRARHGAARHHDAQHLIGALFADAGFDVRLGLYLLPEACYGFAATCAALAAGPTPAPSTAPTTALALPPSNSEAHTSTPLGETGEDNGSETQPGGADEPASGGE